MHSACLLVSKWFIVSGNHDLRLLNTATSSPGSKQELEGGVFPIPCKAKTGEAIVFGHPVCQSETGLVKPSPSKYISMFHKPRCLQNINTA